MFCRDLLIGNSTNRLDLSRIKSRVKQIVGFVSGESIIGFVQNANCSFFPIPKAWEIDCSSSVDCTSYRSDTTVQSSVGLCFISTLILVPHSAMWHKFWDIKQFFPHQVVFADDKGSDE